MSLVYDLLLKDNIMIILPAIDFECVLKGYKEVSFD